MLGLPHFISPETADICHSKHLLREALGKDFDGNTDFITCSNLEEALGFEAFPGMMKPVDSQGQRGCFRVDSADDIRNHFASSFEYSIIGKSTNTVPNEYSVPELSPFEPVTVKGTIKNLTLTIEASAPAAAPGE